MANEIREDEKTKRLSRWSTLFGRSKAQKPSRVEEVVEETKENLEHHIVGDLGEKENHPSQTVGGTGITVNPLPVPAVADSEAAANKKGGGQVAFNDNRIVAKTGAGPGAAPTGSQAPEGEASQAPSIRRGSDPEIEVVGESERGSQDGNVEVSRIEFYRRDQPYFWLSNSSEHAVYLDGVRYPTAEHLFQSLKFIPHRQDVVTKIRKASTPLDATKEARKHITDVKKGWIGKGGNVAAMREVLLLKFSQHSSLRRQLLSTGDSEIIEASPTDAFWGNAAGQSGSIGLGRNELGKALVRTRETLRSQSGLGIGSGAKTV